eukprot:3727565-Alexandrium_andersonii.AAC.1
MSIESWPGTVRQAWDAMWKADRQTEYLHELDAVFGHGAHTRFVLVGRRVADQLAKHAESLQSMTLSFKRAQYRAKLAHKHGGLAVAFRALRPVKADSLAFVARPDGQVVSRPDLVGEAVTEAWQKLSLIHISEPTRLALI